MPQITLEYTDNISFPNDKENFFKNLHNVVSTNADTNINNCKSRLIKLENYFTEDGRQKSAGFIHLEVKLLEGRTQEIKDNLGNITLSFLKKTFITEENKESVQITFHIIDINRKSYFKYPEGTFKK